MNGNPAPAVRVRKNVQKLGVPGDDLDWYAQAVAALKSRPLTDPTSWRYLAGVHGYLRGLDPNPTNVPYPSTADQRAYWNQCQHQTWYFLPWHRAYLACFEQIVEAAVVTLGGPAGWALPYWNYSDPANNNQARLLPAAFVNATLPNGSANPLYVAARASNTANFHIPNQDVSLHCLTYPDFTGSATGIHPGFGGPKTVFSHGGKTNGGLEDTPHNHIHDDIGGATGIMGDPRTAALDPIFWLHHSNIDRLWEVWWRTRGNPNPIDPSWLTGLGFSFHDAGGNVVAFTSSQVLDTTQLLHGYVYDDISDPTPANPHFAALAMVAPPAAAQPERVAASGPVILRQPQQTVPVPLRPQAAQAARARLGVARPARAFLNLENVTGHGALPKYDIYIDVPAAGQDLSNRSPLPAGSLSLFGVQAASEPSGPQAGSGISTVIEITSQVEQLRREGRWDESRFHVTFIRREVGTRATTPMQELKIGGISLYYA